MNVYKYVAENDPNGAVSIINSFGYECVSTKDLGKSLSELVSVVGEPALKKVMDFHPDKEIILEMYSDKESCPTCKASKNAYMNQERFLNVSGSEVVGQTKGDNTTLAHQTNVILVVSALIIAVALISKK
jgi:hypothetical protein